MIMIYFRCKLFYKKGEGWAERGIGNLYLKPSGEKTQLLVRADTTLGMCNHNGKCLL